MTRQTKDRTDDLPDSLHGRFERMANRWSQRIALNDRDQQLTYRDLNALANEQAEKLRADGVAPGDLVALMLPRGMELVVQVLAVLKAGAGYVPIDPNYPRERVEWVIESSQPARLLTQQNLYTHLWGERPPEPLRDRIRWTDSDAAPPANSNAETSNCVAVQTGPAQAGEKSLDVAYVIFTSGSTGKPKGVMVGHQQVLSLLDAVCPMLRNDHTDVWTMFHSLAFDFSVWELWGALTTGARLCIVPQDAAWSTESFAALLRDEKVTILNQTPSAFYALIQAEARARHRGAASLSLRSVIFGGEALNMHQIKRWWASYPPGQPRLINMYGITETTVHVTWLELTPEMADIEGSPIGEAIPGLEVHLLDNALQPVGEGEAGEIHVAGRQLAGGYLGRPDLTASRFIASPFHGGQRLYRSGDLAIRREGQLFYLGRADRQLKIRGFRIEPAEVEKAIESHPAVHRCVVLAQPAEDGQLPEGLLAFLVARTGHADPLPGSKTLRQFLAGRLPIHCVPSGFLFVSALPLTVNGKLDQATLLEQWREQEQQHRQGTDPHRRRLDLLRARLAENAIATTAQTDDENLSQEEVSE